MKSPLLGFNNNVRHKGRVFHIQTEDSGVKHPHIITHLFADGGRILKTTKTSYAEHVGAETMAETVTAMMKEQHKAMFVALREGQYDHLIDAPVGGIRTTGVNQVPVIPAPATSQPGSPPTTGPNAVPAIPAPAAPAAAAPAAAAPAAAAAPPPPPAFKPPPPPGYTPPLPQASPPAPPVPAQRSPSRPAVPNADAILGQAGPRSAAASSQGPRSASPSRPALNALRGEGAPPDAGYQARMQPERPVDLEALERAAQEVQTPFFQQMGDLPPPPAAVLAKKPSGSHSSASFRAVTPDSARGASEPPANPSAGRYTQPRPAAVFGSTRPTEGVSIFGEDLISEKSLDEVILSYLAEDLDTPSEKK